VPTLDQLAVDAGAAAGLPLTTIAALQARCIAALGALATAQLLASNANGQGPAADTSPAAEERLLTVDEAASKLSVTPQWLYRRAKRLGLAIKLGDGTLRFSSAALDAYVKAQALRGQRLR
jgi:hypothetical protein